MECQVHRNHRITTISNPSSSFWKTAKIILIIEILQLCTINVGIIIMKKKTENS